MAGGWRIDRDYINEELGPEFYRVGTATRSWNDEMKKDPAARRFRALDDDGNVYYGGWLLEDDGEEVGDSLLSFVMRDAGAVAVDTKENGVWVNYMG